MLDPNSVKVLSAWGFNVALSVVSGLFSVKHSTLAVIAPWVENLDTFFKSLLTPSQVGVAIVTIVYIGFKIRNERRK
jgi:hypothetical protein